MSDTFTELQNDIRTRADGFVQRKSEFDTELDGFRKFLGDVSKEMTALAKGVASGQKRGGRGRKSKDQSQTTPAETAVPPVAVAAE